MPLEATFPPSVVNVPGDYFSMAGFEVTLYGRFWVTPEERLSRPPQTTVPVVVGLNYETAQVKLREANLNIRVLANRHDLPLEPGLIIDQTPRGGERVDCGTVVGVTMSGEDPWKKRLSS